MTTVRLLLLPVAVAAVSLVPSTASAQQAVQGGGDFDSAPVLAPGRYRDTIRPGETLFYGAHVEEGQKLVARFTLRSPGGHGRLPARARLYNTLRGEDVFASVLEYLEPGATQEVEIRGSVVGPADPDHSEAGVYYVSLALESYGRPDRVEVPLTVEIELRGRAVAGSPTPASPASPTPTLPAPEASPGEEQPDRLPTYIASFLAGTLLGGGLTLAALVRSARRRA